MNQEKQKAFVYSNFDANFIEVLNYIYSQRLLITIAAFACASMVGVWTFFFTTPTYKSTAAVLYDADFVSPLEQDTARWYRTQDIENKLYVISVYLNSHRFRLVLADETLGETNITEEDTLVIKAKKHIKAQLNSKKITDREATAQYFAGLLQFSTDPATSSLGISAYSDNPELSQSLVNLASQTLVQDNLKIVRKELNSVVSFIDEQVNGTQKDLFKLEKKLSRYQEEKKVLDIMNTGTQLDAIQRKSALHINELKVKKAAAEAKIAEIERAIGEFRTNLATGTASPLYMMQLQSKIDILLYQKNLSKKDRSLAAISDEQIDIDLDAAVREFQNTIANKKVPTDPWEYLSMLTKAMDDSRKTHLETSSKLHAIEKVTNTELEKYKTLPTVFREITQLQREIDRTSQLYQTLNNRLKEVQIKRAGMANNLQILKYSEALGSKVDMSPWRKLLVSFLFGAVSLVVIFTLRYILMPTIRSRSDLQSTGVEVIAELPYFRITETQSDKGQGAPLLLNRDIASDEANAIRQARFNMEKKFGLRETKNSGRAKVLSICSANSKEGKSFLTANLGHALASAEYRVLLLDFDALNSSLPNYFNYKETSKVSHTSSESNKTIELEKATVSKFMDIMKIPRYEKNLRNLLETSLIEDFVEELKVDYDVILVDTPPIRNSLEALVASNFSDGLVYVANQRGTLRHDIFRTIDSLKEVYDQRIFAVLNFSYDEVHSNRRRISLELSPDTDTDKDVA